MNKLEFENKCRELEKQGHDLVLTYLRSQINEEFPAVVIFYEYSFDYEDDIPVVYAYSITEEEKQNLISEVSGSSNKEFKSITNKFKNSLLWNKNSCLIGHDFGKEFSNLFVLNDFFYY